MNLYSIKSTMQEKVIDYIYEHPFKQETWNLDGCFLDWIVPRLKLLKEVKDCYPSFMTEKRWEKILNEMIEGFETKDKEDYWKNNEEYNKKIQRSLHLFKKYFDHLWW